MREESPGYDGFQMSLVLFARNGGLKRHDRGRPPVPHAALSTPDTISRHFNTSPLCIIYPSLGPQMTPFGNINTIHKVWRWRVQLAAAGAGGICLYGLARRTDLKCKTSSRRCPSPSQAPACLPCPATWPGLPLACPRVRMPAYQITERILALVAGTSGL